MHVVVLHCHFERGGVTQVALNHAAAIRRGGFASVTLVSSERTGGLPDGVVPDGVGHIAIGELDYDAVVKSGAGDLNSRAAGIAKKLSANLHAAGIRQDDSILHWHNHSLGKNTALPLAIEILADSGWKQLLQIHDFAEDYRPDNLSRLIDDHNSKSPSDLDPRLYPRHPRIHYATLTEADRDIVCGLGIQTRCVHCLPNAVALPDDCAPDSVAATRDAALTKVRKAFSLPSDARWCVYPVRGIRRKNVGELLLLSLLMPANRYVGITLRPATPIEAASYKRWQLAARDHAPRVVFDAGHHDDVGFLDNLHASDFVLSTSVTEGFGMVFLEPWLAGRPVIARNIGSVTADFIAAGIQLPGLYDRLPIQGTTQWLSEARAASQRSRRDAIDSLPPAFATSYEQDGPSDDAETIDFAELTPWHQLDVIQRFNRDATFANDVRSACGNVAALLQNFDGQQQSSALASNRSVIAGWLSIDAQSEKLHSVYQQVLSDDQAFDASQRLPGQSAIELVSRVHRHYPCRTETVSS